MKFKSLINSKIGYEFKHSISETPSSFYSNPLNYVSNDCYQFDTYDDGTVQHSPLYLVIRENIIDFYASLAQHLFSNPEGIKELNYHITPIDSSELIFLSKVKYNADTVQYYSVSEKKVTKSEKKRYDKRYEKVSKWLDGSVYGIFSVAVKNYNGFSHAIRIIDKIRDLTGYGWFDCKEVFGIELDDWNNMRNAVHIIEQLCESHRMYEGAKSSFNCLDNNWLSRQNK